jgi:DNA-binding LacI/PurR family transcriptional regulator
MALKKKVIAFLINQFENTYNSVLWRNVVEVAKEKNVDVVFFVGKNLLSPYDYETQFNVIYSIINKRNVSGVIIGEFLKTFIAMDEFETFLKSKFSKIPIVTLGCKIKNIPMVVLDQKQGIKDEIKHLVNFHKVNQIAFIKGPQDTHDAQERYEAYIEGLKENNIEFNPDLVLNGNFNRDKGYLAAKELIEKRKILPEAIIGANDETILGVLDFLKEKKLKFLKI